MANGRMSFFASSGKMKVSATLKLFSKIKTAGAAFLPATPAFLSMKRAGAIK
jgi:hypothetical protein